MSQPLTLEEVESKIARLRRQQDNGGMANSFPLGCGRVGKMRRSMKSFDRSIDASVRRANELTRLYALRERLMSPPVPEKPKPSREQVQRFALKWFESLKVGDSYTPGNYPLPIIKVTAAAIFTEGCRWSLKELTGIKPSEAKQLRATA